MANWYCACGKDIKPDFTNLDKSELPYKVVALCPVCKVKVALQPTKPEVKVE